MGITCGDVVLNLLLSSGRAWGSPNMEDQVKGVVWQNAADRMRESLVRVGYETWIAPLNFIDLHERKAIIEAPSRFFRDWIKDRYLELMRHVLSSEIGAPVEVSLTVREGGDNSKT